MFLASVYYWKQDTHIECALSVSDNWNLTLCLALLLPSSPSLYLKSALHTFFSKSLFKTSGHAGWPALLTLGFSGNPALVELFMFCMHVLQSNIFFFLPVFCSLHCLMTWQYIHHFSVSVNIRSSFFLCGLTRLLVRFSPRPFSSDCTFSNQKIWAKLVVPVLYHW